MPESGIDNTEGILKRLLVNIEAFKRIEKENLALQTILLKSEAIKRTDYSKKILQEAAVAGKREIATKKLAKDAIDKFRKANDLLAKEIVIERRKNSFLSRKYLELSGIAKKLDYDNKLMKTVLLKTNSQKNRVNQKLVGITEKLQEKHELVKISYKNLLRDHELTKLDMEKKLLVEGKKSEFVEKKYVGLVDAFDRAKDDYNRTRKINVALIQKLRLLQEKSIANENVLNVRTEMIKAFFTNRLKEMAKLQINKEIDYRARIESLSRDLTKYYEELKSSKQKYFTREKNIKEKIKEIFD